MADPVDPETGAPLRRDVRPLTITYKGLSITVAMPGWYGDKPDEGVFEPEDMKTPGRALNLLKARAEGLLEPAEIKRIRRKLGLTQEAAGDLIGGGQRAFQKYETGDAVPSRAISSALILLDHDPTALAVLEARQAKTQVRPHDARSEGLGGAPGPLGENPCPSPGGGASPVSPPTP